MHLWTSAISFAGSVDSPDRFPPQMLSRSTMPAVNKDIWYETRSQPLPSEHAWEKGRGGHENVPG